MSTHLNLLPLAVERRQAIGALVRRWAAVGCAALALAMSVTIYQWRLSQAVERRHAALQTSFDATHQTLQNVKHLRRELEGMQGRQSAALSLASEKPVLTLLGTFASAAQAEEGGVAIEHLTLFSVPLSEPKNNTMADHASHVELRGVATSNVALAEFVAALRAWEIFQSVDLKSTAATQIGDTPARRWVIECVY